MMSITEVKGSTATPIFYPGPLKESHRSVARGLHFPQQWDALPGGGYPRGHIESDNPAQNKGDKYTGPGHYPAQRPATIREEDDQERKPAADLRE